MIGKSEEKMMHSYSLAELPKVMHSYAMRTKIRDQKAYPDFA
jgi:hypothetical protein